MGLYFSSAVYARGLRRRSYFCSPGHEIRGPHRTRGASPGTAGASGASRKSAEYRGIKTSVCRTLQPGATRMKTVFATLFAVLCLTPVRAHAATAPAKDVSALLAP